MTTARWIAQRLSVLDKGQRCHQLMLHRSEQYFSRAYCEYSTHERFTGQNNQGSRVWKGQLFLLCFSVAATDTTHRHSDTCVSQTSPNTGSVINSSKSQSEKVFSINTGIMFKTRGRESDDHRELTFFFIALAAL